MMIVRNLTWTLKLDMLVGNNFNFEAPGLPVDDGYWPGPPGRGFCGEVPTSSDPEPELAKLPRYHHDAR
jgi:hypothetical protein